MIFKFKKSNYIVVGNGDQNLILEVGKCVIKTRDMGIINVEGVNECEIIIKEGPAIARLNGILRDRQIKKKRYIVTNRV